MPHWKGGGEVKNPVRQIYVLINYETANVYYIKKQCEEELNKCCSSHSKWTVNRRL